MSGEKTEKPTPHKLRESRKKGEVANSKDVNAAAAFAATLLLLVVTSAIGLGVVRDALVVALASVQDKPLGGPADWLPSLERIVPMLAELLLPVSAAAAVGAILAGAAQVRGVFSMEPMSFKWERLNPAEGIKKLFSSKQFVEIFKVVLKVSALGGLAASFWWSSLPTAMRLAYAPSGDILPVSAQLLYRLLGYSTIIFVVTAMVDYFHQYYEFMKQQRMSKDDVRREHKEMEGDPQIKGRRKSLAREAIFGRAPRRPKKASVVVTNPTHYAVALYYQRGETPLPIVVDKGTDEAAAAIREEARLNGVPMLEDRALARRLHRDVPINGFIPPDLIESVAAVFKWLNQVQKVEQ